MAEQQNKTALIFGDCVGLCKSLVHKLAARNYRLIICCDDKRELEALKDNCAVRYRISPEVIYFDFGKDEVDFELLKQKLTLADEVFIFSDHFTSKICDKYNLENTEFMLEYKFYFPVKMLELTADILRQRKNGKIAVISSAFGDVAFRHNYLYSSFKSAVNNYTSGLRAKLFYQNVHLMTVKTGILDDYDNYGKKMLIKKASTEYAAEKIIQGLRVKSDVIYVPFFWRLVMFSVRLIPEAIFKILKL